MSNVFRSMVAAAAAAACAAAFGDELFSGLTDANYYSGPKITEDDLVGKVVLVDAWGYMCPPCRMLLPQMQKYWASFKHKPFVLIGSHRQGRAESEVMKLVKANKLTYPIYDSVYVAGAPRIDRIPNFVVVNHRGRIVYSGMSDREAIEAAQEAMLRIGLPPALCDGVALRHFRNLDKQLVLGKSIKATTKTLESAVKNAGLKSATGAAKEKGAEAKALLAAIERAKTDVKREIERLKRTNLEEALKTVKAYQATFPEEGAAYDSEIPELTEKAKKWKEEQKAKAAEAAKAAKTKK